ncbi:MAG: hydrogenase maturation protease [Candidatus Cloacimonetes bacterium]|jgi:hydrogenase maturation protease|nr:hydrogenase maturation protease [Candidatus Cloacimonadota bacterium]
MDKKILFYGYGNPGRQDDALGIRFIEEMQTWVEENGYKNISFDSNYQLNIEDANTISGYDIVFFIDASMESIESFSITKVEQSNAQVEFTMHAISPGVVLSLCQQIYNKVPQTHLIHIKGFEWELEFDKGLTEKAEKNLQDALRFIQEKLLGIVGNSTNFSI